MEDVFVEGEVRGEISYSVFKRIAVKRREEKKTEVIVGGMRHGL